MFASCRYDWQTGLNGWFQLKNDTFDFTVYSGSAPKWYTGPKTDHTTQEIHGKQMI